MIDTDTEMPFAYVFRVDDEDELSTVRDHAPNHDGSIRPHYSETFETLPGESYHIVTWRVE